MKTIQNLLLAAFLLTSFGVMEAAAEGEPKIATVDIQALFKNYHLTTSTQEKLNVERARIQKDNNERLSRIGKLKEEMKEMETQINNPSIRDSEKQAISQQLQVKNQESMALDQERKSFLERRNTALNEKMVDQMKGILEVIRKKVEARAKTGGYNLVVDKGGLSTSQVPLVLFSDIEDLTAVLLAELNKDAPSGGK